MDVAALSMNLGTMKAANAVQISLLKKAMDISEESSDQMIRMMQQNARSMELSVNPSLGGNIDIRG